MLLFRSSSMVTPPPIFWCALCGSPPHPPAVTIAAPHLLPVLAATDCHRLPPFGRGGSLVPVCRPPEAATKADMQRHALRDAHAANTKKCMSMRCTVRPAVLCCIVFYGYGVKKLPGIKFMFVAVDSSKGYGGSRRIMYMSPQHTRSQPHYREGQVRTGCCKKTKRRNGLWCFFCEQWDVPSFGLNKRKRCAHLAQRKCACVLQSTYD